MYSRVRGSFTTTLAALLLAACSSVQMQSKPTLDLQTELAQIQVIAATQAVSEWARQSLTQFQSETGRTDFRLETVVSIVSEDTLQDQQVQLYLGGGPPPAGWFATPLGEDAVAFIVHPDNPIRDLDPESLGAIFSGRLGNWADWGGREGFIQPVIPLEGDELRARVAQIYLSGSAFHLGSRLAPTTQAMLEIVAADPNAIGFAPLHALNGRVKALSIQGVRASERTVSDGTYPLVFPILATAPEEPGGTLRAWLEWVQRGSD